MRSRRTGIARLWLRGFVARELTRTGKSGLSDDPLFEKFLEERYRGGKSRVPNPNPDASARRLYPDVSFQTAVKDDGFQRQVSKEFEAWKGKQKDGPSTKPEGTRKDAPRTKPKTQPEDAATPREDGGAIKLLTRKPAEKPPTETSKKKKEPRPNKPLHVVKNPWTSFEKQDEALEIARKGKILKEEALGEKTANVTQKRRLKFGDHEGDYLWKPKEGEGDMLRLGIESGTYHEREAATYNVDRLFGKGTVVMPTITNGEGSYQAWAEGAQTLYASGTSLDSMSNAELKKNKSLERIMILDAITGNEDRHANNLMLRWTGPKDDPNNLVFDAIDNGLVLADPTDKDEPDHYAVRVPWGSLASGEDEAKSDSRVRMAAEMLSEISEDFHKDVRKVKLEDFVKAIASTGLKDERAITAAAVRLVTLQEDAFALGDLMRENSNDFRKGMSKFLFLSGKDPKKLLAYARAEDRYDDIVKSVKAALG
jgi:hypothetical protein